jgi:endonuclease/exonuclease/phosphatase family metal-dependent hydrolase
MTSPVERLLESHPDVAAAWYPVLSRALGRALTVPGVRRWSGLAQRVRSVAEPAGWTTLIESPAHGRDGPGDQLTVLSANLWHDWPRRHRWQERLEDVAVLAETERVDVLLLQEVARTTAVTSDVWLARRLGMSLVYARANGAAEAIGFEEGLAVLSRFPIERTYLRQLGRSGNPLVRRVAVAARLRTPLGPVLAVSVHLGLGERSNAAQLRMLRAWVAEIAQPGPTIVGGDFNAPEGRAEVLLTQEAWTDTFRDLHPHADASTHRSGAPWRVGARHRRLDYVFLRQDESRPWRVRAASHVDAAAGQHSDHRAVLVRLTPG